MEELLGSTRHPRGFWTCWYEPSGGQHADLSD